MMRLLHDPQAGVCPDEAPVVEPTEPADPVEPVEPEEPDVEVVPDVAPDDPELAEVLLLVVLPELPPPQTAGPGITYSPAEKSTHVSTF